MSKQSALCGRPIIEEASERRGNNRLRGRDLRRRRQRERCGRRFHHRSALLPKK